MGIPKRRRQVLWKFSFKCIQIFRTRVVFLPSEEVLVTLPLCFPIFESDSTNTNRSSNMYYVCTIVSCYELLHRGPTFNFVANPSTRMPTDKQH